MAVFEQNPAVQERPLRQLAEQRGCKVVQVYSDRMSGSKADRPGLKPLMADAGRGRLRCGPRFDRFARSIEQLVLARPSSGRSESTSFPRRRRLDTSTPMGKAMFTIVGAMAELERNVIRERILAGMEHARSRGTKSGRQIGRPVVVFDRARLVQMRNAGASWRTIASVLGISTGTAHTVFNASVQKPVLAGPPATLQLHS